MYVWIGMDVYGCISTVSVYVSVCGADDDHSGLMGRAASVL